MQACDARAVGKLRWVRTMSSNGMMTSALRYESELRSAYKSESTGCGGQKNKVLLRARLLRAAR